jgi:hypothetical protein
VNAVEKSIEDMNEIGVNSQVALLMTICTYLLDDEGRHSSGEIRMMLQDAMDMIQ